MDFCCGGDHHTDNHRTQRICLFQVSPTFIRNNDPFVISVKSRDYNKIGEISSRHQLSSQSSKMTPQEYFMALL